ncbi:hypothetical protein SO694_00130056 [Aureococcus anophagefferens]|uniref:Cation/H+ exchanger domain-containing protein n=1 Tax=Aureococcus anophagefferens TaxID=44056 RepID=A0ABR1GF45_AURAN
MAMERFGMFTFVVILVLGVLSRQYLGRALRLPYTVILYCFVPILVFESASRRTRIGRQKWQILTLAGPGVFA